MPHFIKILADGRYGGEVNTSGDETVLQAAEPENYYIPALGRSDGPWGGKIYDPQTDIFTEPPEEEE